MNARAASLAALIALLFLAVPAGAHRLDEYLQATTISVYRDGMVLQLRLTPGVAIAASVVAEIDTDGDGNLSEAEESNYAERVQRDLSLAVDGHVLPLRMALFSFPAADAMLKGASSISLAFEADWSIADGTHELTFENGHQSDTAVYLVNTLLPSSPDVSITGQQRSIDQSHLQLGFALGPAGIGPVAQ